MRRAAEIAFEMSSGGQQSLGTWLAQQHRQGKSLRDLSREVFAKTGIQVSHETIRAWIREG